MTLLSTDRPQAIVSDAQAAGGARRWAVVGFLFVFMLINFADRAVLGLAAESVMRDLALTPSQFGALGSAFFLFYSISGIALGFLINRFPSRLTLTALVIIWSLAQLPLAFTGSFAVLMASRMLLGAGEGPAYPAAVHCAFKWFPDSERTLPASLITQGSAMGVIIAAPLLNMVIIAYGWQTAFGALGVIGLLWAALWLVIGAEGPIETNVTADGSALVRAPYGRLLFNPTVLCTWFVVFAAYWALAMVLVWFPSYLRTGLAFSKEAAGFWTTLPWVGGAATILIVGWTSQKFIQSGWSSRASRALYVCSLCLVGALCLLALPMVESTALKLALVTLGVVLPNAIVAPAQAILGEVSPVAQRGVVLAVGNAVAASAGILSSYVAGALIERAPTHLAGYEAAFAVCGIVILVANLLGLALIRPTQQAAKLAALGRTA